jgi:hypothetical protein
MNMVNSVISTSPFWYMEIYILPRILPTIIYLLPHGSFKSKLAALARYSITGNFLGLPAITVTVNITLVDSNYHHCHLVGTSLSDWTRSDTKYFWQFIGRVWQRRPPSGAPIHRAAMVGGDTAALSLRDTGQHT